jgi:2-keto-4-pentenoate hydratase/2-oxohepta-3-ene-1,7-dioic acid hydratase in catechol pathway
MPASPALLAYSTSYGPGFGLAVGGGVIEVSRREGSRWPDLRSIFEQDALRAIVDEYAGIAPDLSLAGLAYLPPAPGGKILCVGVNYPDRAAEYASSMTAPDYPSLFVRFAESFVGHDSPLTRPPESAQLDYEGEIAIVIGKAGRRIAKADAFDHIAALTLCNEGTVRDWVRHGKFNVTQGKNFAGSGALGPWLVPFEGEHQIADIRLTTKVNGEIRQDDRTSRMLFDFRHIINYVSTFTPLFPGDIIVTGTPSGAGARSDPPVWLAPGDVVEIEAEGLGLLRNGIIDEVVA